MDFWKCFFRLIKLRLFKSKRKLCMMKKFLSQCIKTDYYVFYKIILLQKTVGVLKAEPAGLKYYLNQENQCLSKNFYKPSFYKLSRAKYRNLFLFTGQFRYVSIVLNKKTVENFSGNIFEIVEYWQIFLTCIEKQVLIYYVRTKSGEFSKSNFFSFLELFKNINILNDFYCFLVLLLFEQNYDTNLRTSLFSTYFPDNIQLLQQNFVESPAIRLLAIQNLKYFFGNIVVNHELNKAFFTFVIKNKQKYFNQKKRNIQHFNKSLKKNLFKTGVIDKKMKNSLIEHDKLCWFLYEKCAIQSWVKNYCGKAVWKIWVPKIKIYDFGLLNISNIWDQVLQIIIYMSLFPISERQIDPFSIGFTFKSFGNRLLSMIINQLKVADISQFYWSLLEQINFNICKIRKDLFCRSKNHLVLKQINKKRFNTFYVRCRRCYL